MSLSLSLHLIPLTAAFALLAAPPASAQIVPFYNLGARPQQTAWTVSGVLLVGPTYDGGERYRALVVPAIDAQFGNGWFASIVQGVGYNFSDDASWDLGVRVGGLLPREAEDEIAGLDDIPLRAVAGAFGNLQVTPRLRLQSALRYGSGLQRDGLTLDFGLNFYLGQALATRWTLNASGQWANAAHLQSYFGVTPAQSAATGYRVFEPGAGFREWRVGIGGFQPINREWFAFGNLSAIRFGAAIDDSPVVRQKIAAQFIVGMAYRF